MIKFELPKENSSIIKVIGVGGGGSNAVNHMFIQGINGVDFLVCNTDRQALEKSPVPLKIQLGGTLTQGLGAGSIPEVGKNSAIESIDQIKSILAENTKMVFITAGMGGGTGTGAAPVIAQVAKDMEILTVGIVTIPFAFEGKRKKMQAETGIEEMKKNVDCLLVIANDKLREIYGNLSISDSFAQADNVLTGAAKSIAELISITKKMNVDFNDVHTAMKNSGVALMSSGSASGENRAMRAVELALNSPLLNDNDITGARYVLLDLTSGTEEITMDELGEITDYLQDATGLSADIKIGYDVNPSLGDKVNVTIIATGFNSNPLATASVAAEQKRTFIKLDDAPVNEIKQPIQNPTNVSTTNVVEEKASEPQMYIKTVEPKAEEPVQNWTVSNAPVQPEVTKIDLFSTTETSEKTLNESSVTNELNAPKTETPVWNESKIESSTPVWNEPKVESSTPVWNEPKAETPQEDSKKYFILTDATDESPLNKKEEVSSMDNSTDEVDEKSLSFEEQQKRSMDRLSRIKELNVKLKTPLGLADLENEPAYKRRNISLNNVAHSSESQVSRFTISDSDEGKKGEIRSNNSFLHDNVD